MTEHEALLRAATEYLKLASPRSSLDELQERRLAELETEMAGYPASKVLRVLVKEPFKVRPAMRGT